MNGQWQDDFESLEDRRTMARAMRDARMHRLALQESAPGEVRHFGADGGLHHRTPHPPVSAVCGCGCQARPWSAGDDSADPLDIVGRQAVDQYSAYEAAVEQRRQRDLAEAQDWLTAHYPRNLGPA